MITSHCSDCTKGYSVSVLFGISFCRFKSGLIKTKNYKEINIFIVFNFMFLINEYVLHFEQETKVLVTKGIM